METIRTVTGLLAAALLAVMGVASLIEAPSETYRGTTGDVLNDALFAAGLLVLAVHLLSRRAVGRERAGLAAAALGCVLLSAGALATVAAEEEVWDVPFVVGFALAAVGWILAAVAVRSTAHAAALLGLVLALAFAASGGGLALAAAVVLGLRAPQLVPARSAA